MLELNIKREETNKYYLFLIITLLNDAMKASVLYSLKDFFEIICFTTVSLVFFPSFDLVTYLTVNVKAL